MAILPKHEDLYGKPDPRTLPPTPHGDWRSAAEAKARAGHLPGQQQQAPPPTSKPNQQQG